MKEMPLYESHKEVRALQIAEVKALIGHPQFAPEGTLLLVFADKDYEPVKVFPEWVQKHRPQAGGYYAQDEDGETYFISEEKFEENFAIEPLVTDVLNFSISQTA